MIKHEAAGAERHVLGELAEMRTHSRRAAEPLLRQKRFAHIDDSHREPERPGLLRDGRGVISGAEDHEIRRRHRDFAEHFSAADAIGTRTPDTAPQGARGHVRLPAARRSDRSILRRSPPAPRTIIRPDTPERGVTSTAASPRSRIVSQSFVIASSPIRSMRMSTAPLQPMPRPQTESLCQVVAHDDRVAGGDHPRCRLGNRRFEASARQRALVRAVSPDEHPRAFTAVRAPFDPHHRGHRRRLASRARLVDRVEEPFGLATIHRITMAQPGRSGNRL